MWRSLFLALGIFSLILGAETLVVDKFLMSDSRKLPKIISGSSASGAPANLYQQVGYQNTNYNGFQNGQAVLGSNGQNRPRSRIVQTKDWMPWSLLATGAVIVLYTYSLPGRGGDSGE